MKRRLICLCAAVIMMFTVVSAVSAAAEEDEIIVKEKVMLDVDFSEGEYKDEPWIKDEDTWNCDYVDTDKLMYTLSGTNPSLKIAVHDVNGVLFPMLISNGSFSGDFTYTCKAVANAPGAKPYIIFGCKDEKNFYAISFEGNDTNGAVNLWKIAAGELSLVQTSDLKIKLIQQYGTTDTFTIEYKSGKITVTGDNRTDGTDNVYFKDIELSGVDGGKIGIGGAVKTVSFDNIKVIQYEKKLRTDLGRVEPDLTNVVATNDKVTVEDSSEDCVALAGGAEGVGVCLINGIEATRAYKFSADIDISTMGGGVGLVFNYRDKDNYFYLPIYINKAGDYLVGQLRSVVGGKTFYPNTFNNLKGVSGTETAFYYRISVTAADNGVIYIEFTDRETNEVKFYNGIIIGDAYYVDSTPYTSGGFGFAIMNTSTASAAAVISNVVIEEKPVMVVRSAIEKDGNNRTAIGKIYSRTELTDESVMLAAVYNPVTNVLMNEGISSSGVQQQIKTGEEEVASTVTPGTYDYRVEYTSQPGAPEDSIKLFFWSEAGFKPLTQVVDIP